MVQKNICMDYMNLNDQERLGRLKIIDYKAMFQAIEVNPVSSTLRVSRYEVQCFFTVTNSAKTSKTAKLCLTVTKILQNF